MKRFGIGIAAGLVAVFGGFSVMLGALAVFMPERLPAPAVTSLVPLDEKLRFLRQHAAIQPTMLAVGSSVTWRQLAGKSLEARAGGHERFLNGATGFLKIHQTHALTQFYLDHYTGIHTVLFLTGLPDFSDCTTEPRQLLDVGAAADYTFGGWPALYFYLTHFSPRRYLRSMLTLPAEKTPMTGGLYMDRYGSGPLDVPPEMKAGLRYDAINPDPACFTALKAFMDDIANRGIRMTVILPPVHPEYFHRYPQARQAQARLAAGIADAAAGKDEVTILSLYDDPAFAGPDFFDAFHLQWPAVQRLSERIAKALYVPPVGHDEPDNRTPSSHAIKGKLLPEERTSRKRRPRSQTPPMDQRPMDQRKDSGPWSHTSHPPGARPPASGERG